MNPKLKAWINFLTVCVGAGLAAYVAAQSAGGNEKAAVIAGVVAQVRAAFSVGSKRTTEGQI